MKKLLSGLSTLTTEKLSQRVLYTLVGISVLIFLLFFFVGFDMPFIDDPNFNEPLFTDVLIVLMWLLLIITIGVSVYSLVKSYKTDTKAAETNGIAEKKIRKIVLFGTIGSLIITFLIASSSEMNVNGTMFSDWIWLKISDMFIITSILMLVVAVGAVIYGATRYIRKGEK